MANTYKFDVGTGRLGDNRLKSRWYADSTAMKNKLVYSEDFAVGGGAGAAGTSGPILYTMSGGFTTVAIAAPGLGATAMMLTPGGAIWEIYGTTAQTLPPILTAGSGLEISLDQVNNEAVEYVPFQNTAYNPFAYTVGTTQPMLFRAAFSIADASGSDQFILGWRKQEAYAVPASFLTTGDPTYTDVFGIGFAATAANPNPVSVVYDKNNSGSCTVSDTGFTWADGKTHVLECRLYGTKVRYFINGVPLGSTVGKDGVGGDITDQNTKAVTSHTLDSTDVMIPFIFIRQDADVTGNVFLKAVQLGPLSEFGLDPNNE